MGFQQWYDNHQNETNFENGSNKLMLQPALLFPKRNNFYILTFVNIF
jgi:hypothetical protein